MRGQSLTVGGKEQKKDQSGKSSDNTRKGKESGGPKQTEKSDSGGKAEKSKKMWAESHWGSGSNTYKGVPQSKIDSHKSSKVNC